MRTRIIKPGFFTNYKLLRLPPITRYLYSGLWCMADSFERLEDDPQKIKRELIPADECDVDAALQSLHDAGLIRRCTTILGTRYIQVKNFENDINARNTMG